MKKEFIKHIIKQLGEEPGIEVTFIEAGKLVNTFMKDTKLRLRRKHYSRDWYLETKREVTPAMVPMILQQAAHNGPLLLLAEYITPTAKQLLRQENVAYADTAGNLYLDDNQLYIHIDAYKPERAQTKNLGRAFTKTGLKLLYYLLVNPASINAPYRQLAQKAGVGLDSINKVYTALLQNSYLIALNKQEYKWHKRDELLLQWVSGYNQTLRPKLDQRSFRPLHPNQDWHELVLPGDTYWGGANAGDLLTNNLIADTWTIYTGQDLTTLMKEMKWVPDPNGPIKVFDKFWPEKKDEKVVPPLLVYADLVNSNNSRHLETAKEVYEKQLQHLL